MRPTNCAQRMAQSCNHERGQQHFCRTRSQADAGVGRAILATIEKMKERPPRDELNQESASFRSMLVGHNSLAIVRLREFGNAKACRNISVFKKLTFGDT